LHEFGLGNRHKLRLGGYQPRIASSDSPSCGQFNVARKTTGQTPCRGGADFTSPYLTKSYGKNPKNRMLRDRLFSVVFANLALRDQFAEKARGHRLTSKAEC
jgi:hypothetical protein